MALLAGRLALPEVMERLAARRPVFHSEADFQFAFAQTLAALDPGIRIRLEVPQRAARSTYVDLTCAADHVLSLVEFKYITRAWSGSDGLTDEPFHLRAHAALDLARLAFVHDAQRLEGWTEQQPNTNGFAVLLTNDNRLWEGPASRQPTRDQAFRIHQGRSLTGTLLWGTHEHPYEANTHTLRGNYTIDWRDYHRLDDRLGGTLRWLALSITA